MIYVKFKFIWKALTGLCCLPMYLSCLWSSLCFLNIGMEVVSARAAFLKMFLDLFLKKIIE